jgi:AcrR family transcriptional regulator
VSKHTEILIAILFILKLHFSIKLVELYMAKRLKTKERIKAEALNLFSTSGYAGGSVRDISKKAGVRESAMYNYYSSKEAILEKLIEDAKENSVGADLLTDELLDKLSTPKVFLEQFVEALFLHWNDSNQKKYLRLILIEQFRNLGDSNISVDILIEDISNICKMIFTQMQKYKFIKKYDSMILAEEFVHPLFMMRLQFLTDDNINWNELNLKSKNHIEYFWNLIKR